jgi:ribosomal protein S18 acetylase RimI-like enzyme
LRDGLTIERLAGDALRRHLDGLAAVLHDVVAGGASVSYLWPFSHGDARARFEEWAEDVDAGGRLLLAAFVDGEVVGTVQVVHALPPNQPHRADVAKLLVHRKARRRGVARALMERAEAEARAEGKTLLVLDTVTGDPADALYRGMGWNVVGTIPNYALYPDGRPCATTVFWKDVSA